LTGQQIIALINADTEPANVIYTHKIDNMIRRFMVPAGAWLHSSGTLNQGEGNPTATSTATVNGRMQAMKLADNAVSYISTTLVFPSDLVPNNHLYNEPPISGVTILWSTNAASSNKKVHCELRFCKASEITGSASNVPVRYAFKDNASGTFVNESANPATNFAIVAHRMPQFFQPGFDFGLPGNAQQEYAPGEWVVMTIVRYGASADDPNDGDMFIYGVEIEYHAVL